MIKLFSILGLFMIYLASSIYLKNMFLIIITSAVEENTGYVSMFKYFAKFYKYNIKSSIILGVKADLFSTLLYMYVFSIGVMTMFTGSMVGLYTFAIIAMLSSIYFTINSYQYLLTKFFNKQ